MKLSQTTDTASNVSADVLIVSAFEGEALEGAASVVDEVTGGLLQRVLDSGDFKGKLFQTATIYTGDAIGAPRVLLTGLGAREDFDPGKAFQAVAAASKAATSEGRKRAAFFMADGWNTGQVEQGVAGVAVGCKGQDWFREEKKRHTFEEAVWSGGDADAFNVGAVLGEAVNLTRELVDLPPCYMYPESFAERAEKVAAETGLQVEVWDEKKLAEEKCGAHLAVGRGSVKPPRLVKLSHNGGGEGAPALALVGKGVTFDAGGLSIKPSDGMLTMKCDMAGAATVMGVMQAIAKLKLPVNVVGFMGLAENLLDADSYKLGDVLTARNGRTIEVHNTDAEGRLVLADTLDVARETGAEKMIDLATLTGACVVALGLDTSGLMTNDQAWCDQISDAAKACGERAWQLPMHPSFGEDIRSEVADIKNVGAGRWGGAITAGKFLEEFVGDTTWTHIDIAGPAFYDKPRPWQDGGGSGCFVRALTHLIRQM